MSFDLVEAIEASGQGCEVHQRLAEELLRFGLVRYYDRFAFSHHFRDGVLDVFVFPVGHLSGSYVVGNDGVLKHHNVVVKGDRAIASLDKAVAPKATAFSRRVSRRLFRD